MTKKIGPAREAPERVGGPPKACRCMGFCCGRYRALLVEDIAGHKWWEIYGDGEALFSVSLLGMQAIVRAFCAESRLAYKEDSKDGPPAVLAELVEAIEAAFRDGDIPF